MHTLYMTLAFFALFVASGQLTRLFKHRSLHQQSKEGITQGEMNSYLFVAALYMVSGLFFVLAGRQ
jgi:hypothetical protein